MGNDMFNEEQLAYAAEQQASRERNSPPAMRVLAAERAVAEKETNRAE